MTGTKGRSCGIGSGPKLQHRTRADALEHLDDLARRKGIDPGTWSTYRCKHCGFFHVGHAGNRDNPRNRKGRRQ